MLKKIMISALAACFVFSISAVSIADTKTPRPKNAGDKLVAGLTNVVTGIVEVPLHISNSLNKKTPGALMQEGIIDGATAAGFRIFSGILDALTFWLPPYDKLIIEPLGQDKK